MTEADDIRLPMLNVVTSEALPEGVIAIVGPNESFKLAADAVLARRERDEARAARDGYRRDRDRWHAEADRYRDALRRIAETPAAVAGLAASCNDWRDTAREALEGP